jgi:membrane protease YdiL (CAAX protease family)
VTLVPVLLAVAVFVLGRVALPSLSDQAQRQLVTVGSAVVVAGVLTVTRSWRTVGFTPPSQWRELRLLWLPALVALWPLFAGANLPVAGAVAILVAGQLVNAFVEEATSRGIVLEAFLPHGARNAVVLSGLLFGITHLVTLLFGVGVVDALINSLLAACFGIGLAAVRLRTRTIWPLILVHAASNLAGGMSRVPETIGESAGLTMYVAGQLLLLGYGLLLVRPLRRPAGRKEGDDATGPRGPAEHPGALAEEGAGDLREDARVDA